MTRITEILPQSATGSAADGFGSDYETPLPGDKPFSFSANGDGLKELAPVRDLIHKHGKALASVCGADAIIALGAIAISEPAREGKRRRSGADELREMITPRRKPTSEQSQRFAESLRRKGA